jgi:hypothetical protein
VVHDEREGEGDEEEYCAGEHDVASHRGGRAPPRDRRAAAADAAARVNVPRQW